MTGRHRRSFWSERRRRVTFLVAMAVFYIGTLTAVLVVMPG